MSTPESAGANSGLDASFVPSRGRALGANAAAGVTGRQPAGHALPSLIAGSPGTPGDHVRAALAVSPLASLVNAAVPPTAKALISETIRDPAAMVLRRRTAIAAFRAVAVKLAPYRKKWSENLPPGSPARALNLPLLHILVKRNGYVDSSIVDDMALGMPIAGEIGVTGALKPRERPAETTLEEWTRGVPERNKEVIDRVGRFRNSTMGPECWEKTRKEIDDGWLTHPVPLTPVIAESICLSPRFAIPEYRGAGQRKVRIIDDLRASGVNAVTSMRDTAVPDSLDCVLALEVYFRLASPGCVLKAASTDFCHAYKTIGIAPGQERFSAVLLGPPHGPLLVSHLKTQPFGSTRAPGNWGRVTALSQWILTTYFHVHLPIYVDDCFVIELAETIESAVNCVHTLAELCGFRLDKDQAPAESIVMLGAQVTFTAEGVSAALLENKRDILVTDLEKIIEAGTLTPGQAAKMRGRLGFAQGLMFGKFGRVQMQPFTNRQYSRALKGPHLLNGELREVIPWWVHVLRNIAPRQTMMPGPKPVLVYCDAAGCGHLGVVIFVDGVSHVFSSHAPEWMMVAECGIYDFEMVAALGRGWFESFKF